MFGYLVPDKEQMKVGEFELYRAFYCGLCRVSPCLPAKTALSYDTVLLALVRFGIADVLPEAKTIRCPAHPFGSRKAVAQTDELRFCASVGSLLAGWKVRDDREDAKGIDRLFSPLTVPIEKRMRRSADLPMLEEEIGASLRRLWELEKTPSPSPDALAECFAQTLSAAFSYGYDGKTAEALRSLGTGLGKWIYLLDAADDLEKDRAEGAFNPFLPSPPSPEKLALSLFLLRLDAEKALEELEIGNGNLRSILHNILSLGLPKRSGEIMERYEETVKRIEETK